MVTMYFNPGSSHMLVGIASQQDQESLIRHETVCTWLNPEYRR
jgi:hypothetical protein